MALLRYSKQEPPPQHPLLPVPSSGTAERAANDAVVECISAPLRKRRGTYGVYSSVLRAKVGRYFRRNNVLLRLV